MKPGSAENWNAHLNSDRSNGRCVNIRVLVVGAGEEGRELARRLESRPQYTLVGFLDDEAGSNHPESERILGTRADVLRVVDEFGVDEVLVAQSPSWHQKIAEGLVRTHPRLKVKVVPSLYETMIAKPNLRTVDDVPLLDLTAPTGLSYPARAVKRAMDIVVSTVLLTVSFPVMLVAAVAIKATTPGPILFRQDRVGRNGRIFKVIKFRTMYCNAEARTGPVLSTGADDPRVTRVGRFLRRVRMDELPQFINVLLGHMSMVGPRPERPVFVEKFSERIIGYNDRHKVRPGITGLAQVYGTYLSDPHIKLRYDLMYVYNQSLWMDMRILFQTMIEMMTGAGS